MRVRGAIIGDQPAQIAAQLRQGNVVANIERSQLFGKFRAIGAGQDPLREIVRESFGKEVMAAERLEGVVEDGRVAALIEARYRAPRGS